ncbi:LysR substrate-binding domain-containing protein [Dongia sp. agr-C8]
MRDLNELYFFAKVVEHGGFSAAAGALRIPKSRLSRHIAQLEARLGMRLLNRTTRSVTLTEAGRMYYQHCRDLLVSADAAEDAAESLRAEPSGLLKVAAPLGIADRDLSPIIPGFLAKYPKIRLNLVVTSRRVDLAEDGFDLALRVRMPGDEDPHLVTRRFGVADASLVATPRFLKRHAKPKQPSDLETLPIVGMANADGLVRWRLENQSGETQNLVLTPRLAADHFAVLRDAVLNHIGLSFLPELYCRDEVKTGCFTTVLPEWSKPSATVQAVYLSHRGMLPSLRAFIDYLAKHMRKEKKDSAPIAATALLEPVAD